MEAKEDGNISTYQKCLEKTAGKHARTLERAFAGMETRTFYSKNRTADTA